MADKMLEEVKVLHRCSLKNGPSCVTDFVCSEGAMTCGRLAEILKAKKWIFRWPLYQI